jgi:hypothetical protein
MGLLLLWCAAAIILPIIQGEGIIAVFFPFLIRRRPVRTFAPDDLSFAMSNPWHAASYHILGDHADQSGSSSMLAACRL